MFGAIGLDIIGLIMLAYSDWTVASLKKFMEIIIIGPIAKGFCTVLRCFLKFKRINWSADSTNRLGWTRRILFRRWSEYLYTYNFMEYCVKELSKTPRSNLIRVIEIIGLKDFYDGYKDFYDGIMNVSKKPFTKKLWDFIFKTLQEKSKLADDPKTAKRICATRGGWILQDSDWNSYSSECFMLLMLIMIKALCCGILLVISAIRWTNILIKLVTSVRTMIVVTSVRPSRITCYVF